MDKKKLFKTILGWLLALVIIYILGKTIYNHRAELAQWKWHISWGNALLSVLTLFGAYVCGSQGWRQVIVGFGHKIDLHESFRVIYLANLGRYVPGKVWQVVGMVGLAKEIKIPPQTSLASFALVQAYALPASFVLIPLALGKNSALESLIVYRDVVYLFFAATIGIFLILFFWPGGMEWALNKVLKLLKQETVQYRPSLGNRLSIFIWYILNWGLFGVSFHFFLRALLATPQLGFVYSSGTYIAAYILGYISFLSPAGLGVREGVMSALLAPVLTPPIAASVALINRVWITIAEAISTLLALATYKIKKK
ncbi:conserved membrane hypothetical protein [Candidatus Zixiibacteriota bacterium]|nr:conserved membrane hypothetical protein [candidate division Zixibacteria bacterium]